MELTDDVMNQVLRDVSKNISKERKKRGLSMAKLAEMSNLSVSHISKLERSRCDIGLKALLRIAAAMEMEADELLPGDFEPKETERKIRTNYARGRSTTGRNVFADGVIYAK